MVSAALAGLLTGLSLIVVIGVQNAFVLRSGLARQRVGLVVSLCAAADAFLIVVGIAGAGSFLRAHASVLTVVRYLGGAYLGIFALRSFMNAWRTNTLDLTSHVAPSRRSTVTTTLALTFLNPHVYLDTVVLLGTIAASYGAHRWYFGCGAALGSLLWFATLGFGARLASRWLARPVVWRILDSAIGVVMLTVAWQLVRRGS